MLIMMGLKKYVLEKAREFAFDVPAKNRHPEIVEDPQYHSASIPSVAISVNPSRDYV